MPKPTGLQKATFQVLLSGSVSEGIDPAVLPDGKLSSILNGDINKLGNVAKRNGFTAYGMNVLGKSLWPSSVGNIQRVMGHGTEVVVADDSANLYSRSPATDSWIQRGNLPEVAAVRIEIQRDMAVSNKDCDCATYGNLAAVAWTDTNKVYVSVYDTSSGTLVISENLLVTAASGKVVKHVRCITFGTRIGVFWWTDDTSYVYVSWFDAALVGTGLFSSVFSTPAALQACDNGVYDVTHTGTGFLLAVHTAANALDLYLYNNSLTSTASTSYATGNPAVIGMDSDCIVWQHAVTHVLYFDIFDTTTLASTVSGPLTPMTSSNAMANVSVTKVSASSRWIFVTDVQSYNVVRFREYDGSGTAAGVEHKHYGVVMTNRPVYWNSKLWTVVVPDVDSIGASDADYDGYFACSFDPAFTSDASYVLRPQACMAMQSSFVRASWHSLPHGGAVGTTKFLTAQPVRLELARTGKTNAGTGRYGTDICGWDNTLSERWQASEAHDLLTLSGGLPVQYDGSGIFEVGFLHPPRILDIAPASGGSMGDNGAYKWKVVYEQYDRYGHRAVSATSYDDYTLAALGAGNTQATLTIKQVELTRRRDTIQRPIVASIYRTQNAGTTFYYVGSVTLDGASAVVTFVDGVADSTIASAEQLYTEGGELDNDPPGPLSCLTAHRDRLVGGSAEAPEVFYSKPYDQNRGTAFSIGEKIPLPSSYAPTAVASLESAFVVLCQDGVFAVEGDGPAVTGQPVDAWGKAYPLSTRIGCSSRASVVQIPQGVAFRAQDGFYILDRGFQFTRISEDIEDTVALYPTVLASAFRREDRHVKIYFLVTDGVNYRILVYDLDRKLWTIWNSPLSSQGTLGAVQDTLHLGAGAVLYYQNLSSWIDGATKYLLSVTTNWINMGSMASFKRLWRVSPLLRYRDKHDVTVTVARNFSEAQLDATTVLDATITTGWGLVNGDIEQFRKHCIYQKGESFLVSINERTSSAGTGGQAFEVIGFLFEVGMKRGILKQEAARSV